jgi:hypothetical protein
MCLNETYTQPSTGKSLPHAFPFRNSLKQEIQLSLLFNFVLEYAIRKAQENQEGQKLNRIHQFLVYPDDGNILDENINTIKKTKEALSESRRKLGLEVSTEKTKHMVVSHHQIAGQNKNISTVNKSFENMATFKYLGTTVTNQNCIYEEIKTRLNSGNAFYHSIQNLSSSRL